jgi:MFS family permease
MGLLGARVTENINGRLAFVATIMMLSQINFGMDLVAFSNTQAMDAFEHRFGVFVPKLKRYAIEPYFLSLLNSLTYVGQVFGVISGGWVVRRYGRRVSFCVMSFWAILSAILLVSAKHKEQVLVGRIVNYIYLGQELVTVPIFQAEICPPKIRGMLVGTFQLGTMVRTRGSLAESANLVGWRLHYGLHHLWYKSDTGRGLLSNSIRHLFHHSNHRFHRRLFHVRGEYTPNFQWQQLTTSVPSLVACP